MTFINTENFLKSANNIVRNPFDHVIIDNFLTDEIAKLISEEFLTFESSKWFVYSNPIEEKKALNDWNTFPRATYELFSFLNSQEFLNSLGINFGKKFFSDFGLHGGGWHIHGHNGNLNPHLDYSIHPKLGLQRKLNLIIYLNEGYDPIFGGHLGLWTGTDKEPVSLIKEVEPIFNRAIIFDTTQNSWHGMSRKFQPGNNYYRRSLAVYYLIKPENNAPERERALYAPREDQKGNAEIERIIELRKIPRIIFRLTKLNSLL